MILELESFLKKPARNTSAARQRKLAFRAHQRRSDSHSPRRSRRAPGSADDAAKLKHELGVRHRVGTGRVEEPVNVVAFDAREEHPIQIVIVQPAYVLSSASHRSAKKEPRQLAQSLKSPTVGSERKADAQKYFSRAGRVDGVERLLPEQTRFNRKALARRRGFVAYLVSGVSVDRQRARLNPGLRGRGALGDRFADDIDRIDSRFDDFPSVLECVAAVDALAGEIDDGRSAIKERAPFAERLAIPTDLLDWPRVLVRTASQHDYFIAYCGQFAGQRLSEKPSASGQDDSLATHRD